MKYEELKKVLGDSVRGIESTNIPEEGPITVYSLKFEDVDRELLNEIFESLNILDKFEIKNVYVGNSGFIIDLTYTPTIIPVLAKLSKQYRSPLELKTYY